MVLGPFEGGKTREQGLLKKQLLKSLLCVPRRRCRAAQLGVQVAQSTVDSSCNDEVKKLEIDKIKIASYRATSLIAAALALQAMPV
jgi:hypothetical protein